MQKNEDIVAIVTAASTLTRIAAISTNNETPAAQWRTLAILSSDGPHRLGELARKSRVTQPGMTRLIRTMTEAGLIERHADPSDSRATVLVATAAGIEALAAWKRELGEALSVWFDDLSDDDWNTVRSAAHILLTRIARSQEEVQ